jgi:uncharacterized damage-inducible protein DinB
MHPAHNKLFTEIELQRARLLDTVRHLSKEQLNTSVGGKWSVAQIMSHLITSEQLSLQYVQKKIQGIEKVADTGLWEEVKMVLLKISQRLPGLKFKAPTKIFENTPQFQDVATLELEWNRVREEFKAFLETFPAHFSKRKIYKHPFAGYLNVKQALVFFREHILHHTPQIKKLL